MQICSPAYSQIDYWDKTSEDRCRETDACWAWWREKSLFTLQAQSQVWRKEARRSLQSICLPDIRCWQHLKEKVGWTSVLLIPKRQQLTKALCVGWASFDRRYIFSISVSLAAKEMNKSAASCAPSPREQTSTRLRAPEAMSGGDAGNVGRR